MECLKSYLILLVLVKGSLCATTQTANTGDSSTMSTVAMTTSMESTSAMMDNNETNEVMSESTTADGMLSTVSMTTATVPTTMSTAVPTTMSTTVPTTMSTTVPTTMSTTVPTTMSTTTMAPASTTPCPVCTDSPNLEESKFGTHGLIGIAITLAIALLLFIALVVLIVRRRMKSQGYDPSTKGQSERRMEGVPLSMPMNNTLSGDFGPNVTTIDLEDENNTKAEPKVGNGAGLSSFGGGKSQEASTEDIDNLPQPSWLTVEPSDNTKASTESLNSSDKMLQPDPSTSTPDNIEQVQIPEPTTEEPVLIPPPDTDSENDTGN